MDISKLNIDQLVKYVNSELIKNSNLSVNKLCDKLEIKRSTLKTKLQKENYFFNINNRSYEKNKAVIAIDDSMKGVIKNDDTNKDKDISTNNDTMKFSEVMKMSEKKVRKIMKIIQTPISLETLIGEEGDSW